MRQRIEMLKNLAAVLLVFACLFLTASSAAFSRHSIIENPPGVLKAFPERDTMPTVATDELIIKKLSPHIYLHTSFLNSATFGLVDCNGMVVASGGEAVVFDTPADQKSSAALIRYVTAQLKCKIIAVIPTHFHEDCVGGLEVFLDNHIPAFASSKTIALLNEKKRTFSKPIQPFHDSITLLAGGQKVAAGFYGEGHTKDNIIGYFAKDQAIFGGCLIKADGATKGNLEDANLAAWSGTVRLVKQRYPDARIVIPGHGPWGTTTLLDYTIKLFGQPGK